MPVPRRPSRTQEYLLDDAGLDGDLQGRSTSRLTVGLALQHPMEPGVLASRIAMSRPDARFIVDSSFFDHTLDDRIWRALLSRAGDVAVLPQVRTELAGWQGAHASHPAARALAEDTLFETSDPATWDLPLGTALAYYVGLLGLRKRLYRLTTLQLEAELGRAPRSEEVKRAKQRVLHDLGDRGVLFARKGAKADASDATFHTDELVTATAFVSAICERRPTVILTRDEDIIDQFYKLQWLLDTHYRGLLFADAYFADPDRFSTIAMPQGAPWSDAFDDGENLLVHRSEEILEAILPHEFEVVPVECWLVREGVTHIFFLAETPMHRLLSVKAATGGLNTKQASGRNCHIWLGPLPIPHSLRGCAAIAADLRVTFGTGPIAAPILDINHALMTGERFRRPSIS